MFRLTSLRTQARKVLVLGTSIYRSFFGSIRAKNTSDCGMKRLPLLLSAILICTMTLPVFARKDVLAQPNLVLPADFPKSDRAHLLEALRHPDSKFISGHSVNLR